MILAALLLALAQTSPGLAGNPTPAISLQDAINRAPSGGVVDATPWGSLVQRGLEITKPITLVGGRYAHGSRDNFPAIMVRRRGGDGQVVLRGVELVALPADGTIRGPGIESMSEFGGAPYDLVLFDSTLNAPGLAVYTQGRVAFFHTLARGASSSGFDGIGCTRIAGASAVLAGTILAVDSALIAGDAGLGHYSGSCGGLGDPCAPGATAAVAFTALYHKGTRYRGGLGQSWTNLPCSGPRGSWYEAPSVVVLP